MSDYNKATEARKRRYWSEFAGRSYLLALMLLLTSCAPKPAEETVTLKPSRRSTASAETPKISRSPLPVPDPDIERAGDLTAEATLHLHQRNSAAALHAVSRAEAEIKRALDKTAPNGPTHDELLSTLGELETVRGAIQRGMFDEAIRRLDSLNRQLDSLD